jgi:exodeoxyribonuclease-1
LAVTGVRPAQLLDPALPTLFEFTQEIGALIDRWSPAIWTGFNSIRFDEQSVKIRSIQTWEYRLKFPVS